MLQSMKHLVVLASLLSICSAQTYTNCNPLTSSSCPADSALGKSVNIDFTKGASDSFTAQGNPTYSSNGVSFTVAKSGDSPQLTSKWYIMFGKVSVTMKAAPGRGIVSSVVLQSDALDEIDWEWLGSDPSQVQTNYFGKGITGSYNRGAFHPNAGNQNTFITYTIEWTSQQIIWQINGKTVRAMSPSDAAQGQYPQTPMQLKLGAWSGGDSSNPQGTITWAGGPTDYSAGPYSMQVKSISVEDYSTGTSYSYGGTKGTWQEVQAAGGSVYSGGASKAGSAAPAVTSTTSGQPMPFDGTYGAQGGVSTPAAYPWAPLATTLKTGASTAPTNYPGLPSGWTVTNTGKVVPPSSAPETFPGALPTSPLSASQPSLQTPTFDDGTWNPTKYDHPASAATRMPQPRSAKQPEPSTPASFQRVAAPVVSSAPATEASASSASFSQAAASTTSSAPPAVKTPLSALSGLLLIVGIMLAL